MESKLMNLVYQEHSPFIKLHLEYNEEHLFYSYTKVILSKEYLICLTCFNLYLQSFFSSYLNPIQTDWPNLSNKF